MNAGQNEQVNAANKSFNNLLENRPLAFESFDVLPFPIDVFAADGTAVFINRASMELYGIPDPNLIIGKYNLLTDPVCNDRMGLRETIARAFGGEKVSIPDFIPPVQDLVDRGIIREKPYESALMEAHFSPVKNEGDLVFVVCMFIVKNIYRGKPEVVKAKEYLSLNWRGKYEPKKTAKTLGMSVTQLYRVFKEHTGMTPGDYHQQCKTEHIKEKLADRSLSVKEAFEACGEDSRGWMLRVFKGYTGFTPTKYRESLP